jgi:hypothetical protein
MLRNCVRSKPFYDGDYCVPQKAATTKRIFGLLSQLLSLGPFFDRSELLESRRIGSPVSAPFACAVAIGT